VQTFVGAIRGLYAPEDTVDRDGDRQPSLVSVDAPRDVLPREYAIYDVCASGTCPRVLRPASVVGDGAGPGQRDPSAVDREAARVVRRSLEPTSERPRPGGDGAARTAAFSTSCRVGRRPIEYAGYTS
jgi:hypothetical protein